MKRGYLFIAAALFFVYISSACAIENKGVHNPIENMDVCERFSLSLYEYYIGSEEDWIRYDIIRETNDTYIVCNDDASKKKVTELVDISVGTVLRDISSAMGRQPDYISINDNEIIFWEEGYGEQIIYSVDGSKPENKISPNNEDLYFVQYDEHWYAYQLR